MPSAILESGPLGFPWPTIDPFLFCVHHDDAYPRGDGKLAPAASLAGRRLGEDFEGKDGWRMYHGRVVPGFPSHPHRGFETVTVVRRGLIDHADSLGAAARYGRGDVQWLTAGAGVVHSEMFPLVDAAAANPLELFQIWLNLPAEDKMAEPHFTMLWADQIPEVTLGGAKITVVAGELAGMRPPAPPPRSWASRPDSDLAIWSIRLDGETVLPPATGARTRRTLYFYRGERLAIGGQAVAHGTHAVRADVELPLEGSAEILVLGGRPIGQPVAHHGPFVMNTQAELQRAFADYQRTRFGGWPWPVDDPVHGERGRFARFIDGHVEEKD